LRELTPIWPLVRHDHVFERDRSGTTKSIDATVFVGPQEEKKSSEAAPGLGVVGTMDG
jgi:hypothetical protein